MLRLRCYGRTTRTTGRRSIGGPRLCCCTGGSRGSAQGCCGHPNRFPLHILDIIIEQQSGQKVKIHLHSHWACLTFFRQSYSVEALVSQKVQASASRTASVPIRSWALAMGWTAPSGRPRCAPIRCSGAAPRPSWQQCWRKSAAA